MTEIEQALGQLLLSIGIVFYRLYVISKVWGYVAVNHLGLQPVGLKIAFGLSLLFTVIISDFSSTKTDEYTKRVLTNAFGISFVWLVAYLMFG